MSGGSVKILFPARHRSWNVEVITTLRSLEFHTNCMAIAIFIWVCCMIGIGCIVEILFLLFFISVHCTTNRYTDKKRKEIFPHI